MSIQNLIKGLKRIDNNPNNINTKVIDLKPNLGSIGPERVGAHQRRDMFMSPDDNKRMMNSRLRHVGMEVSQTCSVVVATGDNLAVDGEGKPGFVFESHYNEVRTVDSTETNFAGRSVTKIPFSRNNLSTPRVHYEPRKATSSRGAGGGTAIDLYSKDLYRSTRVPNIGDTTIMVNNWRHHNDACYQSMHMKLTMYLLQLGRPGGDAPGVGASICSFLEVADDANANLIDVGTSENMVDMRSMSAAAQLCYYYGLSQYPMFGATNLRGPDVSIPAESTTFIISEPRARLEARLQGWALDKARIAGAIAYLLERTQNPNDAQTGFALAHIATHTDGPIELTLKASRVPTNATLVDPSCVAEVSQIRDVTLRLAGVLHAYALRGFIRQCSQVMNARNYKYMADTSSAAHHRMRGFLSDTGMLAGGVLKTTAETIFGVNGLKIRLSEAGAGMYDFREQDVLPSHNLLVDMAVGVNGEGTAQEWAAVPMAVQPLYGAGPASYTTAHREELKKWDYLASLSKSNWSVDISLVENKTLAAVANLADLGAYFGVSKIAVKSVRFVSGAGRPRYNYVMPSSLSQSIDSHSYPAIIKPPMGQPSHADRLLTTLADTAARASSPAAGGEGAQPIEADRLKQLFGNLNVLNERFSANKGAKPAASRPVPSPKEASPPAPKPPSSSIYELDPASMRLLKPPERPARDGAEVLKVTLGGAEGDAIWMGDAQVQSPIVACFNNAPNASRQEIAHMVGDCMATGSFKPTAGSEMQPSSLNLDSISVLNLPCDGEALGSEKPMAVFDPSGAGLECARRALEACRVPSEVLKNLSPNADEMQIHEALAHLPDNERPMVCHLLRGTRVVPTSVESGLPTRKGTNGSYVIRAGDFGGGHWYALTPPDWKTGTEEGRWMGTQDCRRVDTQSVAGTQLAAAILGNNIETTLDMIYGKEGPAP